MKYTQIKIALLLAALSCSGASSQQIAGCLTNTGKFCSECYLRKPLAPKQGCGPVVPESDHCASYYYKQKTGKIACDQCKPGYALKPTGPNTVTCVPGKIKGCILEIDLPSENVCYACEEKEFYSYFDVKTQKIACQPLPQGYTPIKNCQWGAELSPTNEVLCFKCEDGFTASADLQKCHKSKIEGCWALNSDGRTCSECNGYAGYSMQADKSCAKVALTQ